ncbi:MAG: rhodanese-like domain-containing protein [Deltaproteobacteria bacterium]|nr:rhodanese-like domain-containing protein [Deltaproteobacteria bacterium]MDH3852793.1 rhodanese-like domain-containing protein [Deltaproteobacteria bacterium]MDH3964309.1 rhodanese-like domain-containing protein [Deltaproteobacteria bacterium]
MRKDAVALWILIVVAILALVSGCANSKSDPKKVGVSEANVQAEFLAMKAAGEKERGGYKLMSLKELKAKLDAKEDMLVVDTMPYEASYKKQHIPTAVQFEFPIPEMTTIDPAMEKQYADLLGPDKDKMIVVYCGFVKCGRSHNGAMWAVKLGYTNVYRCLGGIRGWQEAGYPVEAVK